MPFKLTDKDIEDLRHALPDVVWTLLLPRGFHPAIEVHHARTSVLRGRVVELQRIRDTSVVGDPGTVTAAVVGVYHSKGQRLRPCDGSGSVVLP